MGARRRLAGTLRWLLLLLLLLAADVGAADVPKDWVVVGTPEGGVFVRISMQGEVEWHGDAEKATIAFWYAVRRRDPNCVMELLDARGVLFASWPDGRVVWHASLSPTTQTFWALAQRTRGLVCGVKRYEF